MDAPDLPGWYAFDGYLDYGHGPASGRIVEDVRVYWGSITQEWQARSWHGFHPVRHLRGKWTRLHAPREAAR